MILLEFVGEVVSVEHEKDIYKEQAEIFLHLAIDQLKNRATLRCVGAVCTYALDHRVLYRMGIITREKENYHA